MKRRWVHRKDDRGYINMDYVVSVNYDDDGNWYVKTIESEDVEVHGGLVGPYVYGDPDIFE